MVGHRRRRQHAGHRADRVRKTLAAFLWAIDRLADGEPRPAARGHPRPVRIAAEGAGRRRRTQPAHAADRHHPHRRAARAARAGHQRRRPLRRHPTGTAARADRQTARHPDHHARVAVPDADVGGPRDARRGADRHRRRGARRRRDQARRAPGALAGAAGPTVGRRPRSGSGCRRRCGPRKRWRGSCPGRRRRRSSPRPRPRRSTCRFRCPCPTWPTWRTTASGPTSRSASST